MNVNDAFPSKYIKAGDLGENRVAVTIDHVSVEEVGRTRDKKPVAYFKGKTKGLVLNKTNARKISDIAQSAETEDWPGVQIVIFASETEFAGEIVECVRVAAMPKNGSARPAPRPAPPPTPDPEGDPEHENFHASDDDIPF